MCARVASTWDACTKREKPKLHARVNKTVRIVRRACALVTTAISRCIIIALHASRGSRRIFRRARIVKRFPPTRRAGQFRIRVPGETVRVRRNRVRKRGACNWPGRVKKKMPGPRNAFCPGTRSTTAFRRPVGRVPYTFPSGFSAT